MERWEVVGWGGGGKGAQRGGGGAAVLGRGRPARRAFLPMRENLSRVHDVFARSALAMGCSVRASCSTNFLLHVGMLVVCVRVRHFFTIAPPSSTAVVCCCPLGEAEGRLLRYDTTRPVQRKGRKLEPRPRS